jgi:hypothetical protein
MGYLSDELYQLAGTRITADQERLMETTIAVLGSSVASFLFVLTPRGDPPQLTNERVQAWVAELQRLGIQPRGKLKVTYEPTACPICGRAVGANWLVRHRKQAHGRTV